VANLLSGQKWLPKPFFGCMMGARVMEDNGRGSASLRCAVGGLEMLPDKTLNPGKMTVWEILKAAPTISESFVDGCEWIDHGQEMVVIIA
jgi:hypothetical protein